MIEKKIFYSVAYFERFSEYTSAAFGQNNSQSDRERN